MMKYEVECQLYIYWVLTTWLELGHMDCEASFHLEEVCLEKYPDVGFCAAVFSPPWNSKLLEKVHLPTGTTKQPAWLKTEKQRASRGRRTSWGGKVKKVAAMDGGWQEQGAFSEERGSSSSYSQLRQQRLEVWTREPMFRLRRKFTCGTPPTKKCQVSLVLLNDAFVNLSGASRTSGDVLCYSVLGRMGFTAHQNLAHGTTQLSIPLN
uniref:Uncharacterized protein n=1 Tax=Oryza glumipatula TaxID=40148 RepID=A0A0D9ZQU6_9ORYZ